METKGWDAERRFMRWLIALAAVAAGLAYALHAGIVAIPDRHNPWAPLALEQPLNWLTRYKLGRIAEAPAQCRQVLSQAEMRYRPLPDRDTGPGCGFRHAVLVEATSAALPSPLALSCRAAVSLALWERHVLQPAAVARFGQRVARLEHYGSYACRNVDSGAARSRHAFADALDVAGFVLENGRRIGLRSHWTALGQEGAFLRELHAGACRVFDGVLGPDYNAAHRDHFHLERGGYRMCR